MQSILSLNEAQKKAVRYLDGPLLVLAGAGSGKTQVITQKIAYLIQHCGYKASSIVAVTFTNKAANEMKTRAMGLLPEPLRRGLKISTFHTLGLSILRKDAHLVGLKSNFTIVDTEDCAHILRELLSNKPENTKQDINLLLQLISRWKNGQETTDPSLEQLMIEYQKILRLYNAVDFDDLIRLPLEILDNNPKVLEHWQNKIRYLLIDEYQDSNVKQYELMKKLVGVRSQFTVVGDDDQSIYAWRGARPENLSQLAKDFPNLAIIKLEQNYRSTQRILTVANGLIQNNPHLFEKQLWSSHGAGDFIRIIACQHEEHEAEQVVMDLISHKLQQQHPFNSYAILYRGNHQARALEKVLRQHKIPYRLSGGQSWFTKKEIKDIFAYLRLICNDDDDAAFLRIINTPKRGIGEVSLNALREYASLQECSLLYAADHVALLDRIPEKQRTILAQFKQWLLQLREHCTKAPFTHHLREMVEHIAYETYIYDECDNTVAAERKMQHVWELLDWIENLSSRDPHEPLSFIINKLMLIDMLEQSSDQEAEVVHLLTLHACKGLEFPYVYLVGMEEELLPHRVSIEENNIFEERRLAFVGITRAQRGLCITYTRKRKKASVWYDCRPSRFLEELPKDCLEWFGKGELGDVERSKALAKTHLSGLKDMLTASEDKY